MLRQRNHKNKRKNTEKYVEKEKQFRGVISNQICLKSQLKKKKSGDEV